MLDDQEERREFCDSLVSLQGDLGSSGVDAFISPSRHLNSLSDATLKHWRDLTEAFIQSVRASDYSDKPIFVSLPINAQPLRDPTQPGRLLNYATSLDVDGFYLTYSVDDYYEYPLSGKENIVPYLELIKHLKKNRFRIIAAHSHHVAHILIGAGIDCFASGHNKNLRVFDAQRFEKEEPGGGTTVFNYYSSSLLNELRVRTPISSDSEDGDDADEENVGEGSYSDLDLLSTQEFDISKIRCKDSPYDETLFRKEDLPSESNWNLRNGEWIHYLWACNEIAQEYRSCESEESKQLETRTNHAISRIDEAESLFNEIEDKGILLYEPEERIYSDWKESLHSVILSDS